MATTARPSHLEVGRRIFSRVLVGVDGSGESLEAARKAALLQDPAGPLTLLSAWEVPPVIGITGGEIPYSIDAEVVRSSARESLATAREHIAPYAPARSKLVRGSAIARLLEEIEAERDTLVAIGSGGARRLLGIVAGSTATTIIHRAPCSVLVARSTRDGFPSRIIVGVDGSPESASAHAAARYLAERFDAELQVVVARGGKPVDEDRVNAITGGDHCHCAEAPADAIKHLARTADFVVVGSRGLHGLSALGSVSERVAHAVRCPALVVREVRA